MFAGHADLTLQPRLILTDDWVKGDLVLSFILVVTK